jgi:hypothetical protein
MSIREEPFFKGEPGYELLEKKIQELLDEHFTT